LREENRLIAEQGGVVDKDFREKGTTAGKNRKNASLYQETRKGGMFREKNRHSLEYGEGGKKVPAPLAAQKKGT